MDPHQQKKSGRDLSDLKARLGLAKQGSSAEGAAPQQDARPATGTHPQVPGGAAPGGPQQSLRQSLMGGASGTPMQQQPMMVPPPGVMPPPGMAQPQPAAPDVRRDPFAAQQAPVPQQAYQPIVDAGPPLEIPEEKKSHTKLIGLLLVTALIPRGVGWACGRIYGARVLFNKGIDAAAEIKAEVAKMSEINKKVGEAIAKSHLRNNNKLVYDEKLLEDLKDILRASPAATPEKMKKRQERLFRNNYAMMEDIVIDRLFNYYNNTIRLYARLQEFIQQSERSAELLKKYSEEVAGKATQKYGIVFAEDAGHYYLGQLVEVGNIVCADPEAKECPANKIKGFMVRTSPGASWQRRMGKPEGNGKITEVVIPIIPDENWRRVSVGKPGYLEFKEYTMGYGRIAMISSILHRDVKPLMQDLGKAAGREKVFAPL